jgi:hypothetical protein
VLHNPADDTHPLAIGGYYISRVGTHPVEAPTVYNQVLERRYVVGNDQVGARPQEKLLCEYQMKVRRLERLCKYVLYKNKPH